ncbi:acyltransferase family protein [Mucilaginibacter calamicampi]|uniref:Acyltransferase family protein n=1 Tax=Mucilaginibacter calamicampi TaxID=1302352 RepID=A0ABW2Z0Z0_9SPHI
MKQHQSQTLNPGLQNTYQPHLDGLRGVAIILVILAHIGFGQIIPGGFGVSLFFFISGLLITRLLIGEYNTNNTINLKNFYLRRIIRLYPALLLMTVLAVALLLIFHSRVQPLAILSSLFYFANYYYIYLKPPATNGFDDIFNIVWSLAIEEHFYLVFPVLFYLLHSKGSKLLYLSLVVCLAAFLYRHYVLYNAGNNYAATMRIYVVTEARVDAIMWGCISALLIYQKQAKWYINIIKSPWALLIGIVIILSSAVFGSHIFAESFRFTRQSIAFMFIVPGIGYLAHTSIIRRIFENIVLVFIGKLSYSLYLFHWLAVTVANHYFAFATPTWLCLMLGLTLLLSLASYYLVERPFVRLRKKFGSLAR